MQAISCARYGLEKFGIPSPLGTAGFEVPQIETPLVVTAETPVADRPMTIEFGSAGGNGNAVVVDQSFQRTPALRITFGPRSENNLIILGPQSDIFGDWKINGSNTLAVCAGHVRYRSAINLNTNGERCLFYWGDLGSSNGISVYIQGDDRSVIIGRDCMVAQRASIMTSDYHPVVDRSKRAWLNPPGSVLIHPHVWIGWESMIMKGVTIGFGSVIGTRAVVTRNVPAHVSVGGVPARVLRDDVMWLRPGLPSDKAIEEVLALEASLSSPGVG
jgi:acetyltransferase-like isoleucine patch superfamily enzyme